ALRCRRAESADRCRGAARDHAPLPRLVSAPREGTRAGFTRHRAALAAACFLCAAAVTARADWLAPDPSFRDAQMQLRYATRDTVGHGADVARLDTLA